jgi:hypothetical protein
MDREQSTQHSSGANGSGTNGNGASGHLPEKCPVTHKRSFTTKLDAEQFSSENQIRFGRQYAYKCEDCPAYHLTSKPPDAYALQKTNLKRLEGLATTEVSPGGSANRRGRGETEAEVKRLWKEGLTDAEIAAQLGISHAGVCHHRKKFGAANSRAERHSPRQPKAPITLSEYSEQKRLLEEEYQANLRALEEHKQRLEEASRLTVSECEEGKSVYIRFGHREHLVIPKDKVPELTDSLMQWL